MFIEIKKDVFFNCLQIISYELDHYQMSLTVNFPNGSFICTHYDSEKELSEAVCNLKKQLEEAKKSFYSDLRSIIEKAVDAAVYGK